MAILNYTTEVGSAKSIAEITGILSRFGARQITTDYDANGFVSAISFVILIESRPLAIQLPVNVEGVFQNLRVAPKVPRRLISREQARNVAWRILKDWLSFTQLPSNDAGLLYLQ